MTFNCCYCRYPLHVQRPPNWGRGRMKLCDLINSVKDRDGLSWRELVARARARGAPPPTGLYYLADRNRPMQDFPRTKTIMGIAAALDVEPCEVAAAALESLGLSTHDLEITPASVEVHSGQHPPDTPGHSGDFVLTIRPSQPTGHELVKRLKEANGIRVQLPPDSPEIGPSAR